MISIALGYGTYGMKDLDVFELVPKLNTIGYELVEFTVAPGWPTAPAQFGKDDRRRLVALFEKLSLPSPVLLELLSTCVDGPDRKDMLVRFRKACVLARDLHLDDSPAIVTSTLGGSTPKWETGKSLIADRLVELANLSREYNVIFAIEPHVGGALDTPKKAVWLMEATQHDYLKLNFDYSHFWVQNIDVLESARLCLPYTVHMHIKDGMMVNGNVKFCLPGDGNLDLARYMRTVLGVREDIPPITVEVSGMVWKATDYDPWQTAKLCFLNLDKARRSVCAAI